MTTGSATRKPLGSSYWRLWSATAASNLGDGMTLVAMPLLATMVTRDPITIAGIGAFLPLSRVAVGLGGGVLVDRFDRRWLMFSADALRFSAMVAFATLVYFDNVDLVVVYALVFIGGVGEFIFDTSAMAVVRDVTPSSRLTTANGWLYAAEDGAQDLAGPPLGTALFAVSSYLPFLADAVTFAVSALLVLSLRGRYRPERSDTQSNLRAELVEGFRYVKGHPLFRPVVFVWFGLGLTLGAALATLVLFALETLDGGELGFGALVTAGAVGVVFGNLLVNRLERRLRPAGVLVGAVVLGGLALIATSVASVLVIAGLAQGIWGIGFALINTEMVGLRQRLIPDALLGRVTGVFGLASSAGMVVGSIAGGALTAIDGPRLPLLVAGIVQVLIGIWWASVFKRTPLEFVRIDDAFDKPSVAHRLAEEPKA